MVGLWAIAISAVITGVLVLRIARGMSAPDADAAALAERLRNARTPREAGPLEEVRIEGNLVEGTDGAIEGPISQRKAVLVEVEATEERSTNAEADFTPLFTERVAKRFAVSCADRRTIEIRLDDKAALTGLHETRTGPVVKASDALLTFLRARGRAGPAEGDFLRRREYRERVLPVGQTVVALGILHEPDIESRRGGYRAGDGSPWVKVDFLDATHDAATLVACGEPEGPGVGGRLGWVVAVGGPLTALALGLAGVTVSPEIGFSAAIFAIPGGTALTWIVLAFVVEMFF